MANPSQRSDPDLNYQFARDWGARRFHVRLADEAARWLKVRREKRSGRAPARSVRLQAWRAST